MENIFESFKKCILIFKESFQLFDVVLFKYSLPKYCNFLYLKIVIPSNKSLKSHSKTYFVKMLFQF